MPLRNHSQLLFGRAQFEVLRFALTNVVGASAGEVTVDGVTMPYLSCGTGPAVFLVHGFGSDKENWLLMARGLARHYRVIMMDLPGFGAATAVPSIKASAKAQAAAVVGFADQLGYHQVHLVGNSMGGGIILRVCQDYPERVRSLALVNAVGPESEPSDFRRILDAGTGNPLIPQSLDDADEFFGMVMEKRPALPQSVQRYALSLTIARRERHEVMWQGWENGLASEHIPTNLSALTAPALVIHGDRDRIIHPSVAVALADQLPNAKLVMLPGVGHVPQIEVPHHTARLLNEFWERQSYF